MIDFTQIPFEELPDMQSLDSARGNKGIPTILKIILIGGAIYLGYRVRQYLIENKVSLFEEDAGL